MPGYGVLVFLAAFGALALGWTLLGWLLPAGEGAVLILVGIPDTGILSRYRWLRGMGLLRCPLIAVAESRMECFAEDVEVCGQEELLTRLEWERNQSDRTGNGNSPGRDQRCGISEL